MTEPDSRKVFVVQGRNEELNGAMFEFLKAIGLSPIDWNQGVALSRHGSPFIGQVLDIGFDSARAVVVLMTPDEVAYLQTRYAKDDEDPETQPAPQVRPNVLFEAGMAMGRDASRTVLVEIGKVRPFSDIAGRHVVRLRNDIASRESLAQRLRTAGCEVNLDSDAWHTAGDFTPPPAPGGGYQLGRRLPSNTSARKPINFDLKYMNLGGNRVDRLEVINRGTENALDVTLELPESAALTFFGTPNTMNIRKIPGSGKSVTLNVMNQLRYFGGGREVDAAFDVTLKARTESGEEFSQEVWVDTQ